MKKFLISYFLEKFITSIKRSVRRKHEIDSQPFRANGLGPGGIVFFDFVLIICFIFIFLYEFSIFYFFISIVDFYLAFLQWKSDIFFSFRKKEKYQELRFFYADKYLYILQNWEFLSNWYLNDLNVFFFLIRVVPFLGVLLLLGCGEGFIFIYYYGINELEQVQPKMIIIQFLDVTCFSFKADRLAKFSNKRLAADYSEPQLMNHYVQEIEAVVTVDHLFIDYRRAQDSNAFEDIYWHNFPGDLMTMSFRFFGGSLGCLGLYFSFDFSFFVLCIAGSCFVFEFFDEFDESYRYLSTITDYRKLFYRQIVFLPQAIAEVYGYTGLGPEFYLNKVRKEIKNFRGYYEKKVRAHGGDADAAFERVGKDLTLVNVDFARILYEKFYGLKFSQQFRLIKAELDFLKIEGLDLLQFFFYLKAKEWSPEMTQRITKEMIAYYKYLQEFSRTNDPVAVNREFGIREQNSAALHRGGFITEKQDEAMKRLFSIEKLASKANLEDFVDILGHEFMEQYRETSQTAADKAYAEIAAKKKEEKLKKRMAKRKKVFKTLNIIFNAERQQFLIDYIVERVPVIIFLVKEFLISLKIELINAFFLGCWFLQQKIFVVLKAIWRFWFKNLFFYLYLGFFICLQCVLNVPFLVFFFFFGKLLSTDFLDRLKVLVLFYNNKLNFYYLKGLPWFRFRISVSSVFSQDWFKKFFPRLRIDETTTPYEALRQMYYLIKLYILQWWHEERYIDIFDLMENDEIRHEVIARVMNSPLDSGVAAVSGEQRAWDDPRIVSGYSNRKVLDASLGVTFGSIGLGLLGSCVQFASYSITAGVPFDIFFVNNGWFGAEGLLIFTTQAADWDLFDTFFDSVSYMHFHAERYRIEEFCMYNMQEIVSMSEDENDILYVDETVFEDEVLPFGYRTDIGGSDDRLLQIEELLLKTRRRKLGFSQQFYHLKYPLVFFDYIKKQRFDDFTQYIAGSDRGTIFEYYDRVKRYRAFISKENGLKHFLRPQAEINQHYYKKFWTNYRQHGLSSIWKLRGRLPWLWWWFYRNGRYYRDKVEDLAEWRPFSIIEYEQREAFFDFHLLNYPAFSRFYWDDAADAGEPIFEDGNEDSQDEMANGQIYYKNTSRIFFESHYTVFKLDCYFFIQRWLAKFFMEKYAMEYYIYRVGFFFVKLWTDLIVLFEKLKAYLNI